MELSIKDRLFIPAVLPKENTLVGFGLKKSILKKIEITEKERDEIGLTQDPDAQQIKWDVSKEIALAADFTSEELAFLKKSCENLVDQTLPDDMWDTVNRIYEAV